MHLLRHSPFPSHHFARCAVAAAALGLSGCVTRGYKLANPSIYGAPVALNVRAEQPQVTATLENVIIYKGPGSWKREAYWDEYVVSLHNRGTAPVVFEAAELYSPFDDALAPGDNPWDLEKSSKKWWQTNAARQTGTYLALGAGTIIGTGMVVGVATSGAVIGGGTAVGSAAAVGAAGAALYLALPVVAGSTIYMNYRRKHQIQDEFVRRRVVLPRSLAPGETVTGSLFFRITPTPRRLVLRTSSAAAGASALTIDLALLSSLHTNPSARRPGT